MQWLHADLQSRRGRIILGVIATALVAILAWRYWEQFRALWDSARHYKVWLMAMRELGPIDLVIYAVLLVIVANIPGVPISVLAFFAGVCFGHWRGFVVDAVGMSCGNMLQAYLFGRVRRRRQSETDNWLYRLLVNAKYPELGLIVGYAVPMLPTMLVNVAANQVSITRKRYVASCVVGSSTIAFVYAFGGDLITGGRWTTVVAVLAVAAVAGGITWIVNRQHQRTE